MCHWGTLFSRVWEFRTLPAVSLHTSRTRRFQFRIYVKVLKLIVTIGFISFITLENSLGYGSSEFEVSESIIIRH
jgi:hypothetical protein